MEIETVNPRGAKFTDEQLRADLASGLKPAEIARKYGVSKPAVTKRVNRLGLATTTAAVAPAESRRFVSSQIDALEQLNRGLGKVNLLMDACDEWLRDANDPAKYDIGARATEISVHFVVEVETAKGVRHEKRKAPLDVLLASLDELTAFNGEPVVGISGSDSRYADPRELILKTVQEGRATVSAAVELAKLLADQRAMQEWREVVLNAIARRHPDVRDEIVAEIRSSLVLRGLLEGPAGNGDPVH